MKNIDKIVKIIYYISMERKQVYSFTLSKTNVDFLKNSADLQRISVSKFLDDLIRTLYTEDNDKKKRTIKRNRKT